MSRPRRIVVVGAGFGGLSAAALLASAGHRVTVVERQAAPGGKARKVAVGGALVDGGPTVLTMRWVFDELFAACGAQLDAQVTLTPAAILARHAWGTDRLDLHADPRASADAIAAFAGPREAAGFRGFMAEATAMLRTLDGPFLRSGATTALGLTRRIGLSGVGRLAAIHPFATLADRIARHFADPRLRQLFGRYATYSGSSPYAAPATLMLIAAVEADGVWLPAGGMSALAAALAALAASRGAAFRHGEAVASLDARGAVLVSGERIEADAVVANVEPQALAAGLFGPAARTAVAPLPARDRSLSALVWTVEGSAAGLPLVHHNVLFGGDPAREFGDLAAGRFPRRPDRLRLRAGPRRGRRAPARGARAFPADCQRAAGRRRCGGEARTGRMHRGDLRAAGAVRPDADPERERADDAGGLRGAVSGERGGAVRPGDPRQPGGIPAAGGGDAAAVAVPVRRVGASGGGGADGGAVGDARGRGGDRRPLGAPPFDLAVAAPGYAWWYVDALSDDRVHGLTIIAFIGSVFSPYYWWRGRRDPLDHVALNVALYGPRGRWAMTERGRPSLTRTTDRLSIGPSAMRWDGDALVIDFAEVGAPLPRRLTGSARIVPEALSGDTFDLDPQGRHVWQPVAPRARVEVRLDEPALSWSGTGYIDSNRGQEPLEAGFAEWQWSRAHTTTDTLVSYEGLRRDGSDFALGLRFDATGAAERIELPPPLALPPTGWRVPRRIHADAPARVVRTWEDSPFYARSTVACVAGGEPVLAVHESLSLDRFRSPVVKAMLPFRMPRRR